MRPPSDRIVDFCTIAARDPKSGFSGEQQDAISQARRRFCDRRYYGSG